MGTPSLESIASLIIHKKLELEEVKIKRVLRKSGWNSGAGLIKMELEHEVDVKTVLRNKSKLKKARAKELRNIYLCQSKKEEVLMPERNEDLILREMGVRDKFVRLHTGHLAPKHSRDAGSSSRG